MAGNILKISEAASIALHAMIYLSKHNDKLASVKEIAAKFEISANHLSKVLQRLTKAGYIESIKGYNGGFRISTDPKTLTFLEIYELFDGKLKTTTCLLERHECRGNCIFGDLILNINSMVKERFESTYLADFINKEEI